MTADYTVRFTLAAERAGWLALDLLFPPRCASCRQAGARLCARCRAAIEYFSGPVCQRCGYPQAPYAPTTGECDQCRRVSFPGQGLRSLAFHSGPLRSAIHALKYRQAPPLSESFATLMTQRWPDCFPAEAVLMAVPLSAERLRERGFNQAELLSRQLSAQKKLPLATGLLQRAKATRPQVGLNRAQRLENVRGAFSVGARPVRNLSIIVVDDVCTTGATLGACADALLQAGASQVWAYTLARARREDADPLH